MDDECKEEDSSTEGINVQPSEEDVPQMPQKRYYRQRAHSNPHSDHDIKYPIKPEEMDWTELYGDYAQGRCVRFADVGCGYGGLLMLLSPLFPDTLMVGLEIRVKVSDFVTDKVAALRARAAKEDSSEISAKYRNIACLRTNAMKYLPNLFHKNQLTKMFFLFPDPHFKKQKHKWRIVSRGLLAEYAYLLQPGGHIYTITDVHELHEWMSRHISEHELFERISEEEMKADPVVPLLYNSTEEGQKVTMNSGEKWAAVFRRLPDPPFNCY